MKQYYKKELLGRWQKKYRVTFNATKRKLKQPIAPITTDIAIAKNKSQKSIQMSS